VSHTVAAAAAAAAAAATGDGGGMHVAVSQPFSGCGRAGIIRSRGLSTNLPHSSVTFSSN